MMRFVHRWGLIGIASALALVSMSCSSGSASGGTADQAAAGPAKVEIMLSEFKIDPSAIAVPVGQPIEFSVMNMGQAQHTFAVDVGGKTYATDLIDPNATVVLKLPALDAGTYAAYCTVSGHKDLGMLATVNGRGRDRRHGRRGHVFGGDDGGDDGHDAQGGRRRVPRGRTRRRPRATSCWSRRWTARPRSSR